MREFYYALHDRARVFMARRFFKSARDGLNIELEARRVGFFAQLSQCLACLHHAEKFGQPIRIRLVSANYGDSDRDTDWLSYFFDWVSPAVAAGAAPIQIHHRAEIDLADVSDIDLKEANALFFRHLRLRDEILEELDTFCLANSVAGETLAVHYRGTDKGLEAPRIPYELALHVLKQFLKEQPNFTSVFVASDERDFISACKQTLQDVRVITYNEAQRTHSEPLHLGGRKSGNYLLGKDALMIALIISRCGGVLRTTSFLSGWSSIFNPDLTVTLLNAPYPDKSWFPEAAIVRSARRI